MINGTIAIILVVVSAGLILFFALVPSLRETAALRFFPVFERLRKAIGKAVENGTRLHISLGKSSIASASNTSALIGLAALEKISVYSSASDRPPVATSGDGALAILSQDTQRASFRMSGTLDLYNPDRGQITGATPFSYVAGVLPLVDSENISAHILIGNFGPEVALITESAEVESAVSFASSDSLPAQAALYAAAQEPLIGEELYAVPAYLDGGRMHKASLEVQDILRWATIITLVAGAIFTLLGIL